MVAHVHGHDVAVLRLRPGLVAVLAAPLAQVDLDDLLVAVVGLAGRVGDVVLLDVGDRRLEREVVRLLRHAQVLVAHLRDDLVLVRPAAGAAESAAEAGVRGEIVLPALRVVPALERVRVVNVRVHRHAAGAQQAETAPAVVGHFDALERDDRLHRRVKRRRRVAPDRQPHGIA